MKKITVTFSRSYEIELPNHEENDQAILLARMEFGNEFEMLDESSDNFSAKISEVLIKE